MSIERNGIMEFRGKEVTIIGEDIKVGDMVPEFTVMTKDWTWVNALEDHQEKVRIIGSLPSLSTGVCDRETKRFNQSAASLGDGISILMVSMDLPFTLNQWCAGAGIDQVLTFSDHFHAEFGEKYGVLIKEFRIFRRAVFVIDASGKAVYTEYMPTLGDEPDYQAVIEAASRALELK